MRKGRRGFAGEVIWFNILLDRVLGFLRIAGKQKERSTCPKPPDVMVQLN